MSSHCGFFRLIKYLSFVPKIKLKIHLWTGRNRHQGFCIVISSEALSHLCLCFVSVWHYIPLEHSLQACLTAFVNNYIQGGYWLHMSCFCFSLSHMDLNSYNHFSLFLPYNQHEEHHFTVCLRSTLVAPIDQPQIPLSLRTWILTYWLPLLHYVQPGCCVPAVSNGADI